MMRRIRSTLFSFLPATRRQVLELKLIILNFQELSMATQAQAASLLTALLGKLDKIGSETSQSLAEIQALKDAAANNDGEVGPELQAAIDAVVSRAQAVDDLVQDAVVTDPNPETPIDPDAPVDTSGTASQARL